jgi:hypothetical protein
MCGQYNEFIKKIHSIFDEAIKENNIPVCEICKAIMWFDEQPEEVKRKFPNSPKQGRSFMAKKWKKVMGNDAGKIICLACFEKKLGRAVTFQDLDLGNPLNRDIAELLNSKTKSKPIY